MRERERASVSASVRNIKRELEREKEGGISSIYTWCPKNVTTGHGNIRMTLSEKERERERGGKREKERYISTHGVPKNIIGNGNIRMTLSEREREGSGEILNICFFLGVIM